MFVLSKAYFILYRNAINTNSQDRATWRVLFLINVPLWIGTKRLKNSSTDRYQTRQLDTWPEKLKNTHLNKCSNWCLCCTRICMLIKMLVDKAEGNDIIWAAIKSQITPARPSLLWDQREIKKVLHSYTSSFVFLPEMTLLIKVIFLRA